MNDRSLRVLMRHAFVRLVLLGMGLLLLAGSVWWDNAANRGIRPRPDSPIPFSDVPQGGVNTYNLHGEVVFLPDGSIDANNKVKRTFEMIAAAGLRSVRVQFPWEDIEVCGKGDFVDCRDGSKGGDTWAKYDYIVEQAERNGLELLVRLDTPPAWARKNAIASPEVQAATAAGRYPLTGPPDDFNDYGDFVAAVAERYPDLRFFQIWNEPNLPGEWNYREQDPAELVELLKIARDRILAVNPDAVIVFPALSPTDGLGDGVNDLEYLQGVYDTGGAPYFDIMSAQLYGLGQPPTEHRYVRPNRSLLRPIETKADVGRVVLLREIMERNGDADKAVWISELGWNSAPPELPHRWGSSVSEQQKGEYLVQAMQRAQREWPWMGAMHIWMFRFGGPEPDPNDPTPFFQLVDFNFNPLPAYNIVKEHLTGGPPSLPPATRSPIATVAPLVAAGAVLAASVASFASLATIVAGVEHRTRRRRAALWHGITAPVRGFITRITARDPQTERTVLALLLIALGVFYFGSAQVPLTLASAVVLLVLSLVRPDLALLLVPLTVPLYLAPKGIWDERYNVRSEGYFVPLHEVVLLCAVAGTFIRLRLSHIAQIVRRLIENIPLVLFFVAGTLGVVVAESRGAALREWRWLIVEPLLFYVLLHFWAHDARRRWQIIAVWLATGVGVAVVGLLQLTGLDLTALFPRSNCFSDRVVLAEGGLRRISSVYCHPNNLGLALGRIWPVLAALSIATLRSAHLHPKSTRFTPSHLHTFTPSHLHTFTPSHLRALVLPLATLVCLGALAASFSKGALMGAFVALLLLGLQLRRQQHALSRWLLGAAAVGAAGVLLLGLVLGVERLNPLGGSSGARVELWSSALAMLRDHPLTGVGLDQFYYYRTAPPFGDRYIDPQARATTEQFAAHPHNGVLDLLVRVGPLGLAAATLLLVQFFVRISRTRPADERTRALHLGLLASMGAALTHGLVDNVYFVPDLAFSFWLTLGLVDIAAVQPIAQTEQIDDHTRDTTSAAPTHAGVDRA